MTDRYISQVSLRDALVSIGCFHQTNISLPPGQADILAAIAMTETPSFSNPGYSNYDRQGDLDKVGQYAGAGKTYGPSVTSFQIRTFREDTGKGTVRDINWLLAEIKNGCRAAKAISEAWGGYDAWTTYTTGKYKAYLQEFYPPPEATYLVVSGDTFYKIDYKLGLRRGQMQLWNPQIDPRKLYSGQELKLGYVERVVAPGDTLIRLMRTAGWTFIGTEDIGRVASFAGLVNPSKIYPNQRLRILKPGYKVAA
jgi:LysM repeat protein